MRRRVWWYLSATDTRAAEDLGINISTNNQYSDTRLPLNVNDSELYPDMHELPESKPRWTEITWTLINIEIGQVLLQINQSPPASSGGVPYELSKAQVLKDLRNRLESKYLNYCDQNIPIQRMSSLFAPLILDKLEFVIQQQSSQRQDTWTVASNINEDTLVSACQLLEENLQLQTDELLRGFHWYIGSYIQYHLLMYMLWHLCVKPGGPNTDRAWNALGSSFQLAEHRQLSTEPGSKWTILQTLRKKALLVREAYNTRNLEGDNIVLAQKLGIEDLAVEVGGSTDVRLSGGGTWGISDYTDFHDWSDMVDNFDMSCFNGQ